MNFGSNDIIIYDQFTVGFIDFAHLTICCTHLLSRVHLGFSGVGHYCIVPLVNTSHII